MGSPKIRSFVGVTLRDLIGRMVQRIVPIELGYSHESPGRFRGLLQLPLVAMLLLPSVVFRVMGEVAEFAYETPLVGNRQSW